MNKNGYFLPDLTGYKLIGRIAFKIMGWAFSIGIRKLDI